MIYVVIGVHEGTYYKAKFHDASDYNLVQFLCKFLVFFVFFLFFCFFFFCFFLLDGPAQTVYLYIPCIHSFTWQEIETNC